MHRVHHQGSNRAPVPTLLGADLSPGRVKRHHIRVLSLDCKIVAAFSLAETLCMMYIIVWEVLFDASRTCCVDPRWFNYTPWNISLMLIEELDIPL